jgi:hypothetical protein
MTLFLETPGKRYEISEIYLLVLTFVLVYFSTRVFMKVLKKHPHKENQKGFKLYHTRGGDLLSYFGENELAKAIVTCISDDEQYVVKDMRMKTLIFDLVKRKLKKESIIVTPNMVRFLSLRLIKDEKTLLLQIGDSFLSSSNRVRLMIRLIGISLIAFVSACFSLVIPYAVFMSLIYFDLTTDIGHNCEYYFDRFPKSAPVSIYSQQGNGHLIISSNTESRQVAIYVPTTSSPDKIVQVDVDGAQKLVTKTYKPARKQAKEVLFSEFRKADPILSRFHELEEPEIPQRTPKINIHNIFDLRID